MHPIHIVELYLGHQKRNLVFEHIHFASCGPGAGGWRGSEVASRSQTRGFNQSSGRSSFSPRNLPPLVPGINGNLTYCEHCGIAFLELSPARQISAIGRSQDSQNGNSEWLESHRRVEAIR